MLSFGDPRPFVDEIRQSGALVICQCQNVDHVRDAIDVGANIGLYTLLAAHQVRDREIRRDRVVRRRGRVQVGEQGADGLGWGHGRSQAGRAC